MLRNEMVLALLSFPFVSFDPFPNLFFVFLKFLYEGQKNVKVVQLSGSAAVYLPLANPAKWDKRDSKESKWSKNVESLFVNTTLDFHCNGVFGGTTIYIRSLLYTCLSYSYPTVYTTLFKDNFHV